MAKTLEQLLSLSSIIANETRAGANTALRVGGMFSDILYFLRDSNYATTSDLDDRIDALVNGAPAAYDTLKEIADVLANNINSIDDILTALGTKVSKDDFNTAIANVNNSISALNTELSGKIDLKLDAVTFNELFEKVQLEDGTWAIKAKLGLFSDGFISAKGSNVGGTSSEGGAVALYQLNDVLADGTGVSGAQHGAVFVYDATIGKWKGVAQSEIVPNLTGYATESWVLSQGFLTEHQDLSEYAKLTDIPTTDINKGVTAYGWGDHSKVGYLTGITSKLVTDALGYTPYDAANFTQAKIKSTLGISDWALASSKPSYTTKEVAEDTNLYFTNARAVAALKSITDGLSGDISTLGGYFTDGVANSAKKLATARTIWGQSFDGTGNIVGVLASNTTKDKYRVTYNVYYQGVEMYASNLSVGDQIGINVGQSYAAKKMAYLGYYQGADDATTRLTLGLHSVDNIIIANALGNVGIGTTSPQYKFDVNGETRTTKLVIGNGSIEWDETNKGFKIVGGLYTESYLSAKGANTNGGGSSGGGLITSLYRYADLGKTFADTNNDTFNAYTINKINTDLGSRISVLEDKATNVSFTQSLTSGTQIGSISIDGVAKNIYAPTIPTDDINKGVTAYGWGNHASAGYQPLITSTNKLAYSLISGVPTSLKNPNALTINNSAGTAQVSYDGSAVKSLTLTKAMVGLGNVENTALSTWVGTNKITTLGTITTGVWNGTKIANGYLANSAITIAGTSVSLGGSITAATLQSNLGLGSFAYKSSLAFADLTNKPTTIGGYGITDAYSKSQVDSALGGYLPLSGGTLTGQTQINNSFIIGALSGYETYSNGLCFGIAQTLTHSVIRIEGGVLKLNGNEFITSGNIGSQSVASATKLQTARSIWGQSFDGTGNIVGTLTSNTAKSNYIVNYSTYYAGGQFYANDISDGEEIGVYVGKSYAAKKVAYMSYHQGENDNETYATLGLHSVDNAIVIKTSGNVGIGTTIPTYKLDVNGTLHASGAATFGGHVSIVSNDWCEFSVSRGTNGVSSIGGIDGGGVYFAHIQNSVTTYMYLKSGKGLSVYGTLYSSVGIYSDGYVSAKGQNTSSDMRLKNVLNEVVLGVKDIANAPSMRFSWKNGGGIDIGSSAQYWQGLLPDAVKERDGMLEMQYANIALLSAIALAKNFETMDERVARLEKENEELRNEINMMRYGA